MPSLHHPHGINLPPMKIGYDRSIWNGPASLLPGPGPSGPITDGSVVSDFPNGMHGRTYQYIPGTYVPSPSQTEVKVGGYVLPSTEFQLPESLGVTGIHILIARSAIL